MDYYNKEARPVSTVWFKLLDQGGKEIKDFSGQACFSGITYYTIPSGAATIAIRHEKLMVPYDISTIRRWIAEINEMGFPCLFVEADSTAIEKQKQYIRATVVEGMDVFTNTVMRHGQEESQGEDQFYHFEVKLSDFVYKSHLISALMLVRCLTESYICKVPEIYFQILDENPTADKFDALQTAHKKLAGLDNSYANPNHMVTHQGNGANISKQELFERYKECGFKVLDGKSDEYNRIEQSSKWKGKVADAHL